jgi:hypothetical protein
LFAQNGGSSTRCCLNKNGKAPRCTNASGAKGACVISSTCAPSGGSLHPGFCLGYPGDVVCCVGGRHGEGDAPPAQLPGVVTQGGSGWLAHVGRWPVERIDGASRLRFHSSHAVAVNKFLLHTIEGSGGNGDWEGGRATLDSKSFWPHFIVAKDRAGQLRIGQFLAMNVQGRACKNPGNAGTIQVEIGGKAANPFTSQDWLAEPVRALFQAVRAVYPSIPNVAPKAFEGSNGGYGSGAKSRIPASQWNAAAGLVGHQHAPNNDHWDPGAINPAVLLRVDASDTKPNVSDDPAGVPTARPDPEAPADNDAEDDNAPPCVANRVPGKCLPTARCSGGRLLKSWANQPPAVTGCGHISDVNVQCCASEPLGDGSNLSGQSCTAFGVPGTCEATANCARVGRQSFPAAAQVKGCEDIPALDIQCCADTKGPVNPVSNRCPEYAGLSFPLAEGSLNEISVNYGFARSNGRRCHAALDIYTKGQRHVVGVDDGVVTAVMKGWYSCSRGSIDAILVYHDKGPLAGKTINYGEVDPGSYNVGVGSAIKKGVKFAVATNCDMLHFELYEGRQTRNFHWLPAGAIGSGCAVTSPRTKPQQLLDPRDLIRCTMPANAKFRHGVSFLEDATDLSLFAADMDGEDDPVGVAEETAESLGAGEIAGIVVGIVLLAACVAAIAYVVVLRRTRDRDSQRNSMIANIQMQADAGESWNEATSNLAKAVNTTGNTIRVGDTYAQQYTCSTCGKSYAVAEDLQEHTKLRHA